MNINANQLIQQLSADLKDIIEQVNYSIDSVEDIEHLNLPEADKKWSMLQCVAHMSLSVEPYVKNIGNAMPINTKTAGDYEYNSHWKGDWFTKLIAPDANAIIKNRMRTMKSMEPQELLNKKATLAEFNEKHQALLALLEAARQYDLNKIKVPTALGPMVKLRLGDAFRFIIAHAQRHVLQLKRIHQNLPVVA